MPLSSASCDFSTHVCTQYSNNDECACVTDLCTQKGSSSSSNDTMFSSFGVRHNSISTSSSRTHMPNLKAVMRHALTLSILMLFNVVTAQKHISGRPCVGCGSDDPSVVARGGGMGRECGTSHHHGGPAFLGQRLMCNPPPTVPDLFGAFSDTLRLQAAVFVNNATKELFNLEPTCKAASKIPLVVVEDRRADDCGTVPCRRAVNAAAFHPPLMASTVRAHDVDEKAASTVRAEDVDEKAVDRGGAQNYGILEDVGLDTWQPAPLDQLADIDESHHHQPPHPDRGLHQAPAIAYQSTVSTSLKPAGQHASPFVALWTTLHGKLLIIAVSISLVAAITVLAVWISLRNRLSEPKYSEAAATEDAVSMYGRVLEEADQQRKMRYKAASSATASAAGNDVTVTLPRTGYQHPHSAHNNNLHHLNHHIHQQQQGAYLGQEFVINDRPTMIIRQQESVSRRYL